MRKRQLYSDGCVLPVHESLPRTGSSVCPQRPGFNRYNYLWIALSDEQKYGRAVATLRLR